MDYTRELLSEEWETVTDEDRERIVADEIPLVQAGLSTDDAHFHPIMF